MITSMRYELNGFRELLRAEKQNSTYANLAQLYGVNPFYLWNIVTDDNYQPPLKVAATLGVVLMRPAPACPRCGDVHTITDVCTKETSVRIIVQKPHKRPRHPRLAIRLDDPTSAARSIRRHMTGDNIKALLLELSDNL